MLGRTPGSIEDLADRLRESGRRERLGKEGSSLVENPAAHDHVFGIPGDVQHVEAWALTAKDLNQLPPTHARHDHIGHQNVIGPVRALEAASAGSPLSASSTS